MLVCEDAVKIDTSHVLWEGAIVGFLGQADWEFLEDVIDAHAIKSVVEFGSGLSTDLFVAKGLEVVSYEDHEEWFEMKAAVYPGVVREWDGGRVDIGHPDLVFIDGPWDLSLRGPAFKSAWGAAPRFIAVHDYVMPQVQKIYRAMKKYPLVGYTGLTLVVSAGE
ncbi:unnamed protein product [marine sediment metagenome]|uniref:Class I SAM-dependent methyltransferase n=1 Tax=marine sediment metagenome TaxID=412755 RepID=X0YYX4_9ZZZZ